MLHAAGGDRFDNRSEQELFIEILGEVEVTLAWPQLRAGDSLKKCWGWDVATK